MKKKTCLVNKVKGYSRIDPCLVPTANTFCKGSNATVVGWNGNPCRTVCKIENRN